MKALLLVAYGVSAFVCGVWALSRKRSENAVFWALVIAVAFGVAAWWSK